MSPIPAVLRILTHSVNWLSGLSWALKIYVGPVLGFKRNPFTTLLWQVTMWLSKHMNTELRFNMILYLNLVTKILMRAISNVHTGWRFPTPGLQQA